MIDRVGNVEVARPVDIDYPVGICLDSVGNLFVADLGNNRVRKVTPEGTIISVAGSSSIYGYGGDGGQATRARLSSPNAVAIDRKGNLYIADTGNDRIRRVARDGVILTVAGNGRRGFAGDGGPAVAAELNGPLGISKKRVPKRVPEWVLCPLVAPAGRP